MGRRRRARCSRRLAGRLSAPPWDADLLFDVWAMWLAGVRPMVSTMDLTLGTVVAALVTGSVGFGLYLYGKNEARYPQLVAGLVLMVYPYFVSGPLATWGIGAAILGGLALALRAGA
jgi:hypothetical protein